MPQVREEAVIAELIIGAAILIAIPAGSWYYFWYWRYPDVLVAGATLAGAFISCLISPALWDIMDRIKYICKE